MDEGEKQRPPNLREEECCGSCRDFHVVDLREGWFSYSCERHGAATWGSVDTTRMVCDDWQGERKG